MRKEWIAIGLFILAIFIEELWTFIDWPDVILTPFIFAPNQKIRCDSFIWILCQHLQILTLISIIWMYVSDYTRSFFTVAFFIQLAEIIEYALNYNLPWCVYQPIPD